MTHIDVLDNGYVQLCDVMGGDETVVESARISYMKQDVEIDDDFKKRFIQRLLEKEHLSPFENVEFRFLVKAPIFVARQWMRHRTWNYSERSMRYNSDKISFYFPLIDVGNKTDNESIELFFQDTIRFSYQTYDYMIEKHVPLEVARMVLPVNTYTFFYAKTDLRNLFHFLELRRSPHAQFEIREYASAIERLLVERIPLSYNAWSNLMDVKYAQ